MRTLVAALFLHPPALPLFTQTTNSKPPAKRPTPTVFQADEGDRWMLLGNKPLIFKVDPISTGSESLVGTEEMSPGNRIPMHKHLHEDEVLFVHKGAGARHIGWSTIRCWYGSDRFHPARKLDRSGELFKRASDDFVLLQQARIRAVLASHVLPSRREIHDAHTGGDG